MPPPTAATLVSAGAGSASAGEGVALAVSVGRAEVDAERDARGVTVSVPGALVGVIASVAEGDAVGSLEGGGDCVSENVAVRDRLKDGGAVAVAEPLGAGEAVGGAGVVVAGGEGSALGEAVAVGTLARGLPLPPRGDALPLPEGAGERLLEAEARPLRDAESEGELENAVRVGAPLDAAVHEGDGVLCVRVEAAEAHAVGVALPLGGGEALRAPLGVPPPPEPLATGVTGKLRVADAQGE
jgi:hypothetical protein